MSKTQVASTGIDLSDTFAFTGTVSGTKGLVNISQTTNDTRTSISESSGVTFFSFNYDQQLASSKILALVHLNGWGSNSGIVRFNFTYDGSQPQTGRATYQYNDLNYVKIIHGQYFFTGASSTGNKAVTFTYDAANGANCRPFSIWNPNHNEDARTSHLVSNITIMEFNN